MQASHFPIVIHPDRWCHFKTGLAEAPLPTLFFAVIPVLVPVIDGIVDGRELPTFVLYVLMFLGGLVFLRYVLQHLFIYYPFTLAFREDRLVWIEDNEKTEISWQDIIHFELFDNKVSVIGTDEKQVSFKFGHFKAEDRKTIVELFDAFSDLHGLGERYAPEFLKTKSLLQKL